MTAAQRAAFNNNQTEFLLRIIQQYATNDAPQHGFLLYHIFFAHNLRLHDPVADLEFTNGFTDPTAYVNNMREGNGMGGIIELQAIAHLLQVQVIVEQAGAAPQVFGEQFAGNGDPIRVYFDPAGPHYYAIPPGQQLGFLARASAVPVPGRVAAVAAPALGMEAAVRAVANALPHPLAPDTAPPAVPPAAPSHTLLRPQDGQNLLLSAIAHNTAQAQAVTAANLPPSDGAVFGIRATPNGDFRYVPLAEVNPDRLTGVITTMHFPVNVQPWLAHGAVQINGHPPPCVQPLGCLGRSTGTCWARLR